MNITSGKNNRGVTAKKQSTVVTRIKEIPRCIYPAGIAVYSLNIDSIVLPSETQRKNTSAESIAALAQSIHKYGVIHPLTVRTLEGGKYELVCGYRRLCAVKLLGLESVNCIVISTEQSRYDAIRFCENVQSEQLHYLDVSEAIGKLVSKYNFDIESAAAKLCVSDAYVRDKLRLLEYSPEQRRSIRASGLYEGQAMSILEVDDESAREKLLSRVIEGRLDRKTTDELVFAYLKKRMKKEHVMDLKLK